MNKKIALLSIPALAVILLFLTHNRVLVPSSPPIPPLPALGGLKKSGQGTGALKFVSLEKTLDNKQFEVKLTILPLPWGQIIPQTSADVKKTVEDDAALRQKLMPKHGNRIAGVQETVVKGRPGCLYDLTSQTDTGESFAKVMDFIESGALYRLSSGVKGRRINAQDKQKASLLFQQYLSELSKTPH